MKRAQLLAALDSVRAWVKDQPDELEPFRLQPIPGLVVQVRDGRSANAEKCARYRERRATRVATGVATPTDTHADTGPTRVVTPVRPVSQPVSAAVSTPLGFPPAPPSGSPSESGSKEITAAAKEPENKPAREPAAEQREGWNRALDTAARLIEEGNAEARRALETTTWASEPVPPERVHTGCGGLLEPSEHGKRCDRCGEVVGMAPLAPALRDWAKRPPRNLDEAREMPLEPRAQRVLAAPHEAQWLQPEQWAEVRLAAAAFRTAVNKPRMPLGRFDTDAGVKRLVELYAAGLTAEEVCGVIPAVIASEWFRSGSPKDLGSLSLTVVRRALGEQAKPVAGDLAALPRKMFGGST